MEMICLVVINNAAHEWLWSLTLRSIHSCQSRFDYETLPRANADKNEQIDRSNAGMLHVNIMGIYMTRSNNSDIFMSNQKQVEKAKSTPFSDLLAHHKTYHAMLL